MSLALGNYHRGGVSQYDCEITADEIVEMRKEVRRGQS